MQEKITTLVDWLIDRGCVTQDGRDHVCRAMRDLVCEELTDARVDIARRIQRINDLRFSPLLRKEG